MTYLATDPTVSAALARASDQPTLGLGPLQARIAADVAMTGGPYSLYQLELGTGAGAGAHFHRTFTESFHVLSGTVQFYDGQRWFPGGPGDHVVVPEGGVHAFRNDAGSRPGSPVTQPQRGQRSGHTALSPPGRSDR